MNIEKRISYRRIALINPFQVTTSGYDIEVVKRKGQVAEIPLGLAYLSAYIKKHGYEVKTFDAHMMAIKGFTLGQYQAIEEVEDELINQIIDFQPNVVGVSCLFHFIYKIAHRIISRVKEHNKEIITVMGGAYPTVSTQLVLSDPNVDFTILGEGERPFLNLLEALNSRIPFSQLTAVGYRNKTKQIVINRSCNRFTSLDEIVIPDRNDFILKDYYHYGRHFIQKFEEFEGHELRIATLTATRGCVFDCTFCISKNIWGGGLRVRDPAKVLDEIEYLVKEHGINYIAFNDDNLIINKVFARQLLKGIIDRKLKIGWTTGGVSIRGLDEEMVNLMVESGCLIFNIAIESGCPEILKSIHKPLRLEEVGKAVALIRKHKNTYVMGLFMLGFSEETKEQFFTTIKFGKSLKFDWILYSCVTPFPGSEIYNESKAKGMLPENIENDFEKLNFRSYIMKPRYLTTEFVNRENYFANLDQNFFENPNLVNGRSDIVLSDFFNVIKLSPTHASAYYCIARIYCERGQRELALRYGQLAKDNLFGIHKEYFDSAGIDLNQFLASCSEIAKIV